MVRYTPCGVSTAISLHWEWSNIKKVLPRFRTDHGPVMAAALVELLAEIAHNPRDRRPGQRNPKGPSGLFRLVEVDGLVVEFIVAEPLAPNVLHLVSADVHDDEDLVTVS